MIEMIFKLYRDKICPKLIAEKDEYDSEIWENIRAGTIQEIRVALEEGAITSSQIEILKNEFPVIFQSPKGILTPT